MGVQAKLRAALQSMWQQVLLAANLDLGSIGNPLLALSSGQNESDQYLLGSDESLA